MVSRPHRLSFRLDRFGDTNVEIECPYDLISPDRPCAMYEDYFETEIPTKLIHECGAKHWLSEIGIADLGVEESISSPPVPVGVEWKDESIVLKPWRNS